MRIPEFLGSQFLTSHRQNTLETLLLVEDAWVEEKFAHVPAAANKKQPAEFISFIAHFDGSLAR